MPIVKGFRRFASDTVSSRRAVTEISNLLPGSNVQQSGRSSAAPFTSKRPIRKRVTSDDRKAMLESFVNKYRAVNLGKFPSITSAQKEVGGGYYLIRKMLQEMEYNSKLSSVEKGLIMGNKKATKGEDIIISREIATESSGNRLASSSQMMDQQLRKDARAEAISNFDTKSELKVGLQPSTSSLDAENSNITRDNTHNVKDKSCLENHFDFDDSEPKAEKQHDGIINVMRDMPESRKDDELQEKPSIWGNLKSLATGFLNIWRK